jgi:tetratricopeptide (TPR) repeat protein
MINHESELNERDVKIVPRAIDIIFFDQDSPIALELPSAEELLDLRNNYDLKLSIPEIVKNDIFGIKDQYRNEFKRLVDKFGDEDISKTYLLNLADLADHSDDHDKAFSYINRAIKLDKTNYSKNKLGDSLIAQGLNENAFEHFKSIVNTEDVYSHLRLAYLYTLEKKLVQAEEHVQHALNIDEIDFKARLFHGAICLWKGDIQSAILSFKIATEEEPTSSIAMVNLAASYWKIGLRDQAYKSLRKSIILDPYNVNAISFFVDASHIIGKDKESIAVLDKFLEFEQKIESIWGQYARAFYALGKKTNSRVMLFKALDALKHQESFSSTSGVWNNMGLCAWELGNYSTSERYLSYSLKKAIENQSNISLPLYNLCGLMIKTSNFKTIHSILESSFPLLELDKEPIVLLEKIKLQHVIIHEAINDREDAMNLAVEYLKDDIHCVDVKLDLLVRVVYFHTVHKPNLDMVLSYENEIMSIIESTKNINSMVKARAINNIAFAYLNFGLIAKVDRFINLMSSSYHHDPFTTATLGMYKITKGNLEEGIELYKEAISMLSDQTSKKRFKQRLNFELGKYYLNLGELRKSGRYFKKASDEKLGFDYVREEISTILKKESNLLSKN